MTLKGFQEGLKVFCSYKLINVTKNFSTPIKVGDVTMAQREFIEVHAKDINNNIYYSELSPLPGLHIENLGEGKNQLSSLLDKIIKNEFDKSYDLKKPFFNLFIEDGNFLPSVMFSIESLLLDWLLKNSQLSNALFKQNSKIISLNKLIIPRSNNELPADLKLFKSIKIKIGRNSVENDIKYINKILKHTPATTLLRLDANKSYSVSSLNKLAKQIDLSRIEYFEEPFDDHHIYENVHFPVAIDESLNKYHEQLESIPPSVVAIIVKPNILGGFSKLFKLQETVRKLNIKIIISSTFNGEIGMKYNGIAALIQDSYTPTAHGLSTLSFFKEKNSFQFFMDKNGQAIIDYEL